MEDLSSGRSSRGFCAGRRQVRLLGKLEPKIDSVQVAHLEKPVGKLVTADRFGRPDLEMSNLALDAVAQPYHVLSGIDSDNRLRRHHSMANNGDTAYAKGLRNLGSVGRVPAAISAVRAAPVHCRARLCA